ncbi:MAG: cyclic nucleotide-binding domain-containing protein [Dehalococcoidia bacterium]|nr:cyclic nucleotide-binding domain-containing protein [Dehalococcoidia bacterium]
MTATMDALSKVPLFKDLPHKSLERIEKFARNRHFEAGDTVFAEGEEGVGFFLITSGKVEASRGGTKLNDLGGGEFFGEMALIDGHRRSATVKAVEPTDCLALMRSDFLAELRNNPDLAVEMLNVMSQRVRELDQRLSVQ